MPWIFNPNRHAVQMVKSNGEECYIPGKARIYLHPDQVGSDLGAKIAGGVLSNKGGDPSSVTSTKVAKQLAVEPDTSSELHSVPVIVHADPVAEPAEDLVKEIVVEAIEHGTVVEDENPVSDAVESVGHDLAESNEDKSEDPEPARRSRRSRRNRQ